jgi:hypothetical protein
MKKVLSVVMAASFMMACKSTKSPGEQGELTGKLVISELCNHYVVSLESGSLDTAKIAASWVDEKRKATFSNAFSVASKCSFAQAGLKEGDVFTFEVSSQPTEENCMQCMAYYPIPERSLYIRNIKKISK